MRTCWRCRRTCVPRSRRWTATGAFNADNIVCSTAFAFFPNGVPGTLVSKNWQGQNLQVVTTDTKVTRGVLGSRGRLGETWNWDAYYQYGRTTRDQIGSGYRRNWAYTFATDAVLNSSGQTVCRVTRDGYRATRWAWSIRSSRRAASR